MAILALLEARSFRCCALCVLGKVSEQMYPTCYAETQTNRHPLSAILHDGPENEGNVPPETHSYYRIPWARDPASAIPPSPAQPRPDRYLQARVEDY